MKRYLPPSSRLGAHASANPSARLDLLGAARRRLYRALCPVWAGTKDSLKRALRLALRPHRRNAALLARIARDARFAAALAGAAFAASADPAAASPPIELSAIAAGTGGFSVDGVGVYDFAGISVSRAGDVNGDGLADVVIGANNADALGIFYAGQSYVVFGKAGGAAVSISDLVLGNGGFVIYGVADTDLSGGCVSGAGDVNGDGLDDVIIGALYGDPGGRADAGQAYVVFGKANGAAVELANIAAGAGGFVINGIDPDDAAGISVGGGGDINGDGLSDVIVGAFFADPGGESRAGETYVVFGKTTGTAVELSAVAGGAGGFIINGRFEDDFSGGNVGNAGDVDGDGLSDVIVSAEGADNDRGEAYVVFGKKTGTAVNLSAVAAGTGGFIMTGANVDDAAGTGAGGAGDVNGDGLADVVVGSAHASPGGILAAGQSYVVFGKTTGTAVNLAAVAGGAGGFAINGVAENENSGTSTVGAGDVNGDGLSDVIIGVPYAKGPLAELAVGDAYVVFGKADGSVVALASVAAGTGGFLMNGIAQSDEAGYSVSGAGDVNGDGIADVIVGAFYADPGGIDEAGQSYVVFSPETIPGTATYRAKTFPGDGPGGAIVPVTVLEDARVKINFSDEDAGNNGSGGASLETVGLTRNDLAISNLASAELVPDVMWQITTDRTGWASAEVTLQFTDAEIAGLVESDLKIHSAPAPSGPWTELPTTVDVARNQAKATVSSFSYFAMVGPLQPTPTPTPTPTPPPASVKDWLLYE